MIRAPLLVALGLTSGCLSPGPPARWETDALVVRAAEPERAEAIADHAAPALRWIRATLPGLRPLRPELWEVDRIAPFRGFPHDEATRGLTFRFLWIERIFLDDEAPSSTATHELGHLLLDRDWDPLPPFLEEGLCEWLAVHAPAPEAAWGDPGNAVLRAQRLGFAALGLGRRIVFERVSPDAGVERLGTTVEFRVEVADLAEVARFDSREMLRTDVPDRMAGFAYGFALFEEGVDRFGLAGWRELCLAARAQGRSRIELETILAALGHADAASFAAGVLARLDAAALTFALDEALRVAFRDVAQEDLLSALGTELRCPAGVPGSPSPEILQLRVGLEGSPARVNAPALQLFNAAIQRR